MTANIVEQPYNIYNDIDGSPLENGYIYIGSPGKNAEASPIPVFSDNNLTSPVLQPIRTQGGYPVYSGTPINIYTASQNYSVLVKDKNMKLVTSSLFSFSSFTGSIVNVTDFGAVGDGVTDDTVPVENFFAYLSNNGGKGIINVPVRVGSVIVSNNPVSFVVEWLGDNTVLTANTIATPLTFLKCSFITFIRAAVDGRASEQGAINISDGVFNAMDWLGCSDMYSYQTNVRNYNGVGVFCGFDGGLNPVRNFIINGQADCSEIGEQRSGFTLSNARDSSIVNCYANGLSTGGFYLRGGSLNCTVDDGIVKNTARGVYLNDVESCAVNGTLIENCDQGVKLVDTTACSVDVPIITTPSQTIYSPGDVRGVNVTGGVNDRIICRKMTIDDPLPAANAITLSGTNLNEEVSVDNLSIVGTTAVGFSYSSGTSFSSIEILRAQQTGDSEYSMLRQKVVDDGSNNSFIYKGGSVRLAPTELVRYASGSSISILNPPTGLQDMVDLFSFADNEFIKEGDSLVITVEGVIVGSGVPNLSVYFGSDMVAQVGLPFSDFFFVKFILYSTGVSSQKHRSMSSSSSIPYNSMTSSTSNVNMASSVVVSLKGSTNIVGDGINIEGIIAKTIRAQI